MSFRISTGLLLIGAVLVVGFFQACGDLFGDVENRFDPQSAAYVPPQTTIVSGPSQDAILDTADVTFTWRHADSAMWPDTSSTYDYPARILYSYRLDYSAWTDWISGEDLAGLNLPNWVYDDSSGLHILELRGLEDDAHLFQVRSKYPSEVEESGWPQRSFTVDALSGTALLISPAFLYPDSGSNFIVSIKAVDVNDLLGLRLVLDYDPARLAIDDYSLKTDTTDWLGQSGGDVLQFIDNDVTAGCFDVSLAIAGGTVTGISGTGIVARIRFNHVGAVGATQIDITAASALRDVYNRDQLTMRQPCRIVVW